MGDGRGAKAPRPVALEPSKNPFLKRSKFIRAFVLISETVQIRFKRADFSIEIKFFYYDNFHKINILTIDFGMVLAEERGGRRGFDGNECKWFDNDPAE